MIKIDKEKCIGCGACIAVAENTFKFDDDGKVGVANETGDDAETIKSAVETCPAQAITIE
ncbi:MAG: ferredoxin [Patescibacteria group bacterium]|jgi:ferredoxin|nr:ferredoxin [Patescibacteria group bacterium]